MFHSDYAVGCDAHPGLARQGRQALLALRGPRWERGLVERTRVKHVPGAIGAFLAQFPDGTPRAWPPCSTSASSPPSGSRRRTCLTRESYRAPG